MSITFLTEIIVLRGMQTTGQLCARLGIKDFHWQKKILQSDGVPCKRSQCECETVQVLMTEFDQSDLK